MAKVTLVSHTKDPVETIYLLWQASRHDNPIPSVDQLKELMELDGNISKEVRSTFKAVVDSKIPVSENISFTFLLEGVSVALREQLVRHRIGVHVGDRVGVDIVPDLADSTFWSQSMRILDVGQFANSGKYDVPESLEGRKAGHGKNFQPAESLYRKTMFKIQEAYNDLVEAGVPLEDARMLVPLATQSRISWTLNLAALQHIVGKRGCWILQGGLWESVVRGMVEELKTKVDPVFGDLIQPPCVKGIAFKGCLFGEDNRRRVVGEDEIPPCPLWLNYEHKAKWHPRNLKEKARSEAMRLQYRGLWGRDVDTAKPI